MASMANKYLLIYLFGRIWLRLVYRNWFWLSSLILLFESFWFLLIILFYYYQIVFYSTNKRVLHNYHILYKSYTAMLRLSILPRCMLRRNWLFWSVSLLWFYKLSNSQECIDISANHTVWLTCLNYFSEFSKYCIFICLRVKSLFI